MADFPENQDVTPADSWVDVTSTFTGKNVAIQNCSKYPMLIMLTANEPTEKITGMQIPTYNYPPVFVTVLTKIWAKSQYHDAKIHISETD